MLLAQLEHAKESAVLHAKTNALMRMGASESITVEYTTPKETQISVVFVTIMISLTLELWDLSFMALV